MDWNADKQRRYLEQYNPCDDGLHVCGLREDGEFGPHVTEANFPGVGRDTFDALKGIRRQMLEPMLRKLEV